MGVSGGEEGARFGPSLMPGGDRKAFEEMELILVSVAAQIDAAKAPQTHAAEVSVHLRANACVSFLGPGGCGNFVKMVHNGIEYGDMQIIAEVYSLLRHSYNMSNEELSSLFAEWNKTELNSYLIEITSQIFKKKDPQGNGYLIDEILDAAGSKGTGKWTVQQAAEWGVPVPCLSAALEMRYISAHRGLRERLGCLYTSAWQRKGVQQNLAERPSLGSQINK
ncbi:6-phosphogluconate dehydrogenase, decarboxylating, related [Eimeria tenella]|uniref:phosphogluconate dehydrogenase (NADP(+)-dependent, decarboxylating) n=1 Tax=Eimeria tenella TaxID=5802 RepID=U6KPH8_EIMTE|nr:6-phosphogluconate dehydrogenase, decarboxylating, related [Eimeria tenella]CDJ38818.1 6-phosphogluconate dehydrogenase, decarboxylating, related [Eimeria tenella]|eukprot:XP_013229574.1 6-phosphogluconate dehydrogenase, decarboxylating, related [Eimeria tenella]